MTYCVGVLLEDGIVLGSDSRTHAGVDDFASFCKMTVFERPGDRVLVLLSSGNLAGTQAVISVLTQRAKITDGPPNLAGLRPARCSARLPGVVSDAMRETERRDKEHLAKSDLAFNASFILGGQIRGEAPRLFRIYAEGNFIEAAASFTPFFADGREARVRQSRSLISGSSIRSTSLILDAAGKAVLVSFELDDAEQPVAWPCPSTSLCYERDALEVWLPLPVRAREIRTSAPSARNGARAVPRGLQAPARAGLGPLSRTNTLVRTALPGTRGKGPEPLAGRWGRLRRQSGFDAAAPRPRTLTLACVVFAACAPRAPLRVGPGPPAHRPRPIRL